MERSQRSRLVHVQLVDAERADRVRLKVLGLTQFPRGGWCRRLQAHLHPEVVELVSLAHCHDALELRVTPGTVLLIPRNGSSSPLCHACEVLPPPACLLSSPVVAEPLGAPLKLAAAAIGVLLAASPIGIVVIGIRVEGKPSWVIWSPGLLAAIEQIVRHSQASSERDTLTLLR